MAEPRPLARPPVLEAVIDLRVQPADGLSFETLDAAFATPPAGYYRKGPVTESTMSWTLGTDGAPTTSSASARATGLRLHSIDERYVVQFGLNGVTLSRLPPYEDWEPLLAEARRLWAAYVVALRPVSVQRVATRYLNDLQLPLENGASFQTYLRRLADLPPEMPQMVAAFSQRFVLKDTGSGAMVALGLSLDPPFQGPRVPVILDVDAYHQTVLAPDDPRLWELLQGLRTLKNRCFFSTLTEEALELYR